MNLYFKTSLLALSLILLSGCSQKTTIKAIKPAPIHDKDIKKISIEKFSNDTISLAANIASNMSNISFNDKKYFTIVNRTDIKKITKEQKLQDSGLVDIDSNKRFDLGEVNSIITGKIYSTNFDKRNYYIQRTDYNKCAKYKSDNKTCESFRKYTVLCTKYNYSINSSINISRVSNSSIIYSKNYDMSRTTAICKDESRVAPSPTLIYNQISKDIANQFVSSISPSYQYFSVVLKEDADIDYNEAQEKLLENGLKLLKLKDIKKANEIFQRLVNSTHSKSITALYNLAVTLESLGDLETAYELYKKAEYIAMTQDLDEDIIIALKRVEKSISNRAKANQQIDSK